MNEEIKKKWLNALRSGDYTQAKKELRITLPEGGKSFCCLGVLCDIHSKETKTDWDERENSYFGDNSVLPKKVVEWAGLVEPSPYVNTGCQRLMLSYCNDVLNMNFFCIADLIEKQL